MTHTLLQLSNDGEKSGFANVVTEQKIVINLSGIKTTELKQDFYINYSNQK